MDAGADLKYLFFGRNILFVRILERMACGVWGVYIEKMVE